MVSMSKIDNNTWAFTIAEDNDNQPPKILATGHILASSKEICLENIVTLFKNMGQSIKNTGTSPSVSVWNAVDKQWEYGDLSPDLERHDK